MSRDCPDCNGRVVVGYVMPEGLGPSFVPYTGAKRYVRELAVRKTKMCQACGLDSLDTPPR